jgi:ferric-dicitrate binding protein FerR (iron transport regulator)
MKTPEKCIENKKFIKWVFNQDDKTELYFQNYFRKFPEKKDEILKLKDELLQLQFSSKTAPKGLENIIYNRIISDINKVDNRRRFLQGASGFAKYAAIAIVFFALGALFFYQKEDINPQFYSQNLEEPKYGEEAKLIRSNGENIVLDKKNSIIEYNDQGEVKINDNVLEPVNQQSKGIPEMNQLVISYGKTSELLLPDGTKVYLNAGSRLVYPEFFVDKTREVFLVGEGYFEVSHDAQHPFVVQTTDVKIKVLGTKFNVSAYPSDNTIEAVLTEGKVSMYPVNGGFFSGSKELKPSQLASFDKSTREIHLKTVETDNYTLWKDGLFKFESTDLNRITKRLERFYNIHFLYADPLDGLISISGKLRLNEDKDEIINRLAVVASVKISKKGENYYQINQ